MNSAKNQKLTLEEMAAIPIPRPEYFNFAYDVVDEWAARDRNKLAMIWTNQKGEEKFFTFHELSKLSNQAANLLLKHGVVRGDRVFMMLPRLPEWWIFSLALIKLGAVQCPSPTLLTQNDLLFRINYGKFKVVITDTENAEKFDDIYEDCPNLNIRILVDGRRKDWVSYPDALTSQVPPSRHSINLSDKSGTKAEDLMLLIFTSGTSKHPKMVMHRFDYPLGHIITAKIWHGVSSGDLHCTVSDTGWGKNMWGNYFGQWILGTCVFIYDARGRFNAEELLPLMEKYEITSFCAPPTVYRMLIINDLRKFDFKELKKCTSAGEPLHTETVKVWQENTGLTIRECFGQTETVCMIGTFTDMKIKPGSMGKPSPGWDIELHDDEGNIVNQGEEGRIALKLGSQPPLGFFIKYWQNDEENERSFQNGFYYTGDKARMDEEGYFWFVGRSDDIIKSSGYRIGPMEVEEVLMQHPAVQEVAVVGAPDPVRGSRVKAYVVLHAEYYPTDSLVKELQQHVKRLTAPYKYPREIEFFDKLPKTFSGKIKRDLLRKHAESGEASW